MPVGRGNRKPLKSTVISRSVVVARVNASLVLAFREISYKSKPFPPNTHTRDMSNSAGLNKEQLAHILDDRNTDANFADKFVGDEAVRQISEALSNNCSKTRVLLDRNCVGAAGASALGDMLKVGCRYTNKRINFWDLLSVSP